MGELDQYYAQYYDLRSPGLAGDVQFYLEEAQKAGSPVLELGCGTGRMLIPLAEAGVRMVGLDLNPDMLAQAYRKIEKLPQDVRDRIEIIEGDMRTFSLDRKFDMIMIPYRAFLHLMTPEDQKAALLRIHEHLSDGGRLVFNIFDPRMEIIATHSGALGQAVKMLSKFQIPDTDHTMIVWDTRQYHPQEQTIEQYFIIEELDGGGVMVNRHCELLTLRYAFRWEMHYLLELCGFKIDALYGDFQRGLFRYGNEQIWVASKGK